MRGKLVLTLRLCGGVRETSTLSRMAPFGGTISKPAIMRRVVVPAAGRAEHREELAGADREVGLDYRDVVLEALGDMVDLDDGTARCPGRTGLTGGLRAGGGSGVGQGRPPSSQGQRNATVGLRRGAIADLPAVRNRFLQRSCKSSMESTFRALEARHSVGGAILLSSSMDGYQPGSGPGDHVFVRPRAMTRR